MNNRCTGKKIVDGNLTKIQFYFRSVVRTLSRITVGLSIFEFKIQFLTSVKVFFNQLLNQLWTINYCKKNKIQQILMDHESDDEGNSLFLIVSRETWSWKHIFFYLHIMRRFWNWLMMLLIFLTIMFVLMCDFWILWCNVPWVFRNFLNEFRDNLHLAITVFKVVKNDWKNHPRKKWN